MACTYLYNFLKCLSSSKLYMPSGTFDIEKGGEAIEGSWRRDRER
jgi:hypothetical protein